MILLEENVSTLIHAVFIVIKFHDLPLILTWFDFHIPYLKCFFRNDMDSADGRQSRAAGGSAVLRKGTRRRRSESRGNLQWGGQETPSSRTAGRDTDRQAGNALYGNRDAENPAS